MISIPEFRKLLGVVGESLSNEQVEHIRDLQDRLADVVFEMWLKDRNKPE